jgi:hypothetical protein
MVFALHLKMTPQILHEFNSLTFVHTWATLRASLHPSMLNFYVSRGRKERIEDGMGNAELWILVIR